MTADQVKGRGFRGALQYNLKKVERGVAVILSSSFASTNADSILREIAMVRMQRPNLQKYFYHTSLNLPPAENLPNSLMITLAKRYMEGMGFVNHQYILFRHFDAEHPHMHVLVNRIGYDGTVITDSQDYKRSERVLRALEKAYGLTQVLSSKEAMERSMTKNELELMKRTDTPSTKMKLQQLLKGILQAKPTVQGFIDALGRQHIDILFNQASTGFVSGISYKYQGLKFKGSHLGNRFKWQAIKLATAYEQERDRAAIHQANHRSGGEQFEDRRHAKSNSTGEPNGDFQDHGGELHQASGELQDQLRKASRLPGSSDERARHHSNQPGISASNTGWNAGTNSSAKQKCCIRTQELSDSDTHGISISSTDSIDDLRINAQSYRRKGKRR